MHACACQRAGSSWKFRSLPAFPPHHQESEAVGKLVGVLDTLWRWVDETPPAAHTLRYGNPAYRTWCAKMAEATPQVGVLAAG